MRSALRRELLWRSAEPRGARRRSVDLPGRDQAIDFRQVGKSNFPIQAARGGSEEGFEVAAQSMQLSERETLKIDRVQRRGHCLGAFRLCEAPTIRAFHARPSRQSGMALMTGRQSQPWLLKVPTPSFGRRGAREAQERFHRVEMRRQRFDAECESVRRKLINKINGLKLFIKVDRIE